jgi:hypothetical protein
MVACRSVLKFPPTVPMMLEDCALVTSLVVMVKVALVDPAGTVTLAGTVAAAVLSLVRSITKPPEGAAELSLTVPVAELPPITSIGVTLSEESDGAAARVGADVGVREAARVGADVGVREAARVGADVDVRELTVQPDSLAEVGLVDPSLTSTVQSAGAVKLVVSILKRPAPSLVPIATPSTVIVRLGLAWPSMRSCVPLSSARVMLTAAWTSGASEREIENKRATIIVAARDPV